MSLDYASASNPDNEGWRRYNMFDKHYVGRGAGARGAFDRSPDPTYQLPNEQLIARNNEYRATIPESVYRRNPYLRDPSQYSQIPSEQYQPNSRDRYQNPSDQFADRPDRRLGRNDNAGNVCRDPSDRRNFYAHQNDGFSCSAFSMAMMSSDWTTGRPPTNSESSQWKVIAGTTRQGYRGTLNQVAADLREGIPGLQTKVYNYGMGRVGQQAMQDLNAELAQGHTAVAKVINPHTGNPHYIYIAGRTQNGDYIVGDPDRKNPHHQPISGEKLMRMMSRRDGFVAGWKDTMTAAAQNPGTAANRYAMSRYA